MDLNQIKGRWVRGFTLLEALIALVVFSIALLGLAALYTKTLSLSHSSYLRTLASIQAMDLEERIRANPLADNGVYEDYPCDLSTETAGNFSNNLGPVDLAEEDMKDWCGNTLELFGGLLVSAGVVASTPAGTASEPVLYDISISWSERALDLDDATDEQMVIEQKTFNYRMRR